MDILNVVKPQNKKFVAKMVEYGDKNKYDDKDKNNEYFQVIVCPKELITDMAPGDLVSMEGRKMIEKKIDGEIFYILEQSQIDFIIKQEDVEDSLLK